MWMKFVHFWFKINSWRVSASIFHTYVHKHTHKNIRLYNIYMYDMWYDTYMIITITCIRDSTHTHMPTNGNACLDTCVYTPNRPDFGGGRGLLVWRGAFFFASSTFNFRPPTSFPPNSPTALSASSRSALQQRRSVNINWRVHECMDVCMFVWMNICMFVWMFMCMDVYLYVCMIVYV